MLKVLRRPESSQHSGKNIGTVGVRASPSCEGVFDSNFEMLGDEQVQMASNPVSKDT